MAFTLTLSSPSAGTTLGTASATGTINDCSLLFDFSGGTVPASLTYARATQSGDSSLNATDSATYFDGTGMMQTAATNTARFDYDPISHENLGILLEPRSMNFMTGASENFGGSLWFNDGSANQHVTVATDETTTTTPRGDNTADLLKEDGNTGNHYLISSVKAGLTSGYWRTFTLFVKAAQATNSRYVVLRIYDASDTTHYVQAGFNPVTGQASAGTAVGGGTQYAYSSVTLVGNGWYRLRLSGLTSSTASTSVQTGIYLSTDLAGTSLSTGYTGDTSNGGVYLWGAQLENGMVVPTSYIANNSGGANLLRVEDKLYIKTTDAGGAWFSNTFSQMLTASFAWSYPPSGSTANIYSTFPNLAGLVDGFVAAGHSIADFTFSASSGRYVGNYQADSSSQSYGSGSSNSAMLPAGSTFQIANIASNTYYFFDNGNSHTGVAIGATPSTYPLALLDLAGNSWGGGGVGTYYSKGAPIHIMGYAFRPYALTSATVTSMTARTATNTASTGNSTTAASAASVSADGVSTANIIVRLKNVAGNPVQGKTVTLTSNGPSDIISVASGTSTAQGYVTFMVRSTATGTSTFTATDVTDSVTLSNTASINFTP